MQQQNIHYPGHVILGDLERVGLVVLKSGYNIQPFCNLENALYDLNNQYPK